MDDILMLTLILAFLFGYSLIRALYLLYIERDLTPEEKAEKLADWKAEQAEQAAYDTDAAGSSKRALKEATDFNMGLCGVPAIWERRD